ncbi:hypothetical protein HU200_055419 [Digitaria exilis]|uniref:Uncharacterized protein n=1 Tax=Digitaria exilis TaxID=1010633 RepID=A0A835AN27_9POAL|nr:hypothetical protein HU200_055419 [Digitaria exilis]
MIDKRTSSTYSDLLVRLSVPYLRAIHHPRTDVLSQLVLAAVHNSVPVGLPFSVSPANLNLIFYNCTSTKIPKAELVKTKCSSMLIHVRIGGHYNDSSNYTQYSVEGCSTTLVPVLGTYGKPNASNYEQLISDGFLLTWQLPSDKKI